MTREEYNEYRYIRSMEKRFGKPKVGCLCTIRTNGSEDFKRKLDELYTSWDMHPAAVKVDTHYFDDKERIVYICGRLWKDDNGNGHCWKELYSGDELKRFADALC